MLINNNNNNPHFNLLILFILSFFHDFQNHPVNLKRNNSHLQFQMKMTNYFFILKYNSHLHYHYCHCS